MASMQELEVLTNSRFYFEADGLTDKLVLEADGLNSETPSAGAEQVLGSTKQAVNYRQATPTQVDLTPINVKIVLTNNKDFYQWYDDCNKNSGGASSWDQNRKTASLVLYDQAASEQARWNIKNCYPNKYEGPQLDANSSDIVNETFTLVHEGVERVL